MSEKLMDLSREYEKSFQNIREPRPGELIEGTVLSITPSEVFLDINWFQEISIPIEEFTSNPVIGEKTKILCYKDKEDNVLFSKSRGDAIAKKEEIVEAYNQRRALKGKVIGISRDKKSISIDLAGVQGICYLDDMEASTEAAAEPTTYVGKEFTFMVKRLDEKRIVLSRREYILNQSRIEKIRFFSERKVGMTIEGSVKEFLENGKGVVIELNGFTGFLPTSEVSWSRYKKPEELLDIGEALKLVIIKLDQEKKSIILSLKQMQDSPWNSFKTEPEATLNGTVRAIIPDGVIVEVSEGIEGYISKRDLSWLDKGVDALKKIQVGEVIEAKVVRFEPSRRSLQLSVKQLLPNPWDSFRETFSVGQKIKGIIRRVVDFGVFVEIEAGVEGLLSRTELSWTKPVDPIAEYGKKINEEIEVIIKEIEAERNRVALSVRALFDNPWDNVRTNYPVGSTIEVVLSEISETKLLAKISDDIEGIIPKSEVSLERIQSLKDKFKVGDKVVARVKSIEQRRNSLVLSIKDLLFETQEKDVKDFLYTDKEEKVSFGSFLKK